MGKKRVLVGFFLAAAWCCVAHQEPVFDAWLSDGWYPHNAVELNEKLDNYFQQAHDVFPVFVPFSHVGALVVPHAGWRYSGLCAASAYQVLKNKGAKNKLITRVIVVAPSHKIPFEGVALPPFKSYRMPLGVIPIDQKVVKQLEKLPLLFHHVPAIFEREHAVEIELPFLQKTIEQFELVPLIVGSLNQAELVKIAALLKKNIDEKTLVVVSSDFVHYGPDYAYQPFKDFVNYRINQLDSRLVSALSRQSLSDFNVVLAETQATVCGQEPLRLLLELAHQEAFGKVDSYLTCYYTSPQMGHALKVAHGDDFVLAKELLAPLSLASNESSVSYVGMVFGRASGVVPFEHQLTGYEKKALLQSARQTVKNDLLLSQNRVPTMLLCPLMSRGLSRSGGIFVTLKSHGELRGCIGRITSAEPLYKSVLAMANAAAFHDSRFEPLGADEYQKIVFAVSLLTPPQPIERWQDVVIGQQGVILEKEGKSALFLPQVALEQGWDRETMLTQLAQKAGLPQDAWRTGATFKVFEGSEIQEDNKEGL